MLFLLKPLDTSHVNDVLLQLPASSMFMFIVVLDPHRGLRAQQLCRLA